MVSPSSEGGGARRARFTGDVSAVGSRIQFMFNSFQSVQSSDTKDTKDTKENNNCINIKKDQSFNRRDAERSKFIFEPPSTPRETVP
jgi:hypothetical protein